MIFLPSRGGKLRQGKASCLARGGGQDHTLAGAGLIWSGYFLIRTMSIRGLLLHLASKLFRNYTDALHHQILITRSAFLGGLHGAVQAASQAPESQASSPYAQRLLFITAGKHQLSSDLISTSYCPRGPEEHGASISISTSQASSKEGNDELQA